MKRRNFHRAMIGVAAAAALASLPAAVRAEPITFRITLETSPNHLKTKAVEKFVQELKRRTDGQLDVKLFHSAQLFKERDVAKALRQGAVEMAVPSHVHLDGFEPNAGIVLLPAFYGLSREQAHTIMNGKVGDAINQRLESKLGAKVIGRNLDLGFVHTYSSKKKIARHEDLSGMKIRVQGGAANIMRYKFFGGIATAIPWPDVPLALSQGTVDGISSSHESVRSAKLWESGLRYAFEDHQWFAQYIPMVSSVAWERLGPSLQQAVLASWEAIIDEANKVSFERDREARQALIDAGITFVSPATAELTVRRNALLATQPELIKELNIDSELGELLVREVKALK